MNKPNLKIAVALTSAIALSVACKSESSDDEVEKAAQALAALQAEQFDCMVLDLKLPGMSGLELLKVLRQEQRLTDLPVIVYTAKSLTKREETELNKMSREVIIKDVRSPERLLDETALFLHRVAAKMPAAKRQMRIGKMPA